MKWLSTLALTGCALLVPTQGLALENLTGVYEGLLACEQDDGSGKLSIHLDTGFDVSDDGAGNIAMRLHNNGLTFRGAVTPSTDAPDRGGIGALLCSFSATTGGNLLHGAASTKPGSPKATLQLDLVDMFIGSHSIGLCRFKGKRTTTTLGSPVACP
jgi:hypothetical protein